LVAQAEATWLKLVVALTGCTEGEAQSFLQKNAAAAKQEIMPLAKTAVIESYELEELYRSIETPTAAQVPSAQPCQFQGIVVAL
jgi:Tfp pilus assembly protein PilP